MSVSIGGAPGDVLRDFVAGAGLCGAIGGVLTLSPGLFLMGAFFLWLGTRG